MERRRIITLFATAALAGTGCGKHCGHRCDDGTKESFRDRLHDKLDRPREAPAGRGPDPSLLRDPVVPPGVIPPRDYGIPPTSVPTTPGFDPIQPLPAPGRSQFRPDPIPPIPAEPLPQYKSNKELLLPEPVPAPGAKSQSNYDPLFSKSEKVAPDRTMILMEPIMATTRADLPNGILQPPVEVPVPVPVPMQMPGKDELPPTVPDKPGK